jgi:hypothetical protein
MENAFHEYFSFIIINTTNTDGVNQRYVPTKDAPVVGKFQKNMSSLISNFVGSKNVY